MSNIYKHNKLCVATDCLNEPNDCYYCHSVRSIVKGERKLSHYISKNKLDAERKQNEKNVVAQSQKTD